MAMQQMEMNALRGRVGSKISTSCSIQCGIWPCPSAASRLDFQAPAQPLMKLQGILHKTKQPCSLSAPGHLKQPGSLQLGSWQVVSPVSSTDNINTIIEDR
jgi:hypothetical protein